MVMSYYYCELSAYLCKLCTTKFIIYHHIEFYSLRLNENYHDSHFHKLNLRVDIIFVKKGNKFHNF